MTPLPIAANEAPVHLPQVEVTGDRQAQVASPKFTEPLRDTPRTVVAIPESVYSEQGATSLSDVLRNTPGITFFAGEGGSANRTGGDSFYLRGFDTSNSIFIDGVRDEGAVTRDTFNIEQVDIVKGPSADNGRGGTAGYIDLETKRPQARAFEDATLSYGFDSTSAQPWRRATLDVNQPLDSAAAPGAAARVDAMVQCGGVPGRQQAEKDRWSVAPSLALGLGRPLHGSLAYQHTRENNLPDYGLPSGAVAGLVPPGLSPLYSPGVPRDTYYGFADFDHEGITNDTVTGRVGRDLDRGAKLEDQLRYGATNRLVESTSPTTASANPAGQATLAHAIFETRNTILSNQTSLRAAFDTGPAAHSLSSGLELSRERALNPTWAVVPNGVANPAYLGDVYRPQNFPAALLNYAPHRTGSGTDTRTDTGALYAFDTVKLGRWWEAVGGLRAERYDVREFSATAASPAIAATAARAAAGGVPATAATSAVAAVPAATALLTAARTTLSGKAGLVFKPSEDGSLYASYDNSVRPPGSSAAANALSATATSADNPLLKPQRAENYETGVKWSLFRSRLDVSLAFFRSVNSNVAAADPVTGLVDQTSDQTVEGVELGASGRITDAWLVFAGYSRMHPKVSALISTNAQGLTLPLLPRESGNLWTTYRLPCRLTFGGGGQYLGETQRLQATSAPTATTFSGRVPSYWVFNALLAYELSPHATLRLNVNNVGDRRYIAGLNNNGFRVNLGAPRACILAAEFRR